MPKKRTPLPPVDASSFAAHTPLARATVVRFLGEHTVGREDYRVGARNRASKRLTAAVKKGVLREVSPGIFAFGDIVRWARRWRVGGTKFDGYPETPPPPVTMTASAFTPMTTALVIAAWHPTTIKESHKEIDRLYELVVRLERALQKESAEVERLRPFEVKKLHKRETNRLNGGGRKVSPNLPKVRQ